MPKVVDAEAQRRDIRRAARRVFARKGVTGTGLARVAEAAGMGRSSLYHYYPDKETLVRDLLRDVLREEEALFLEIAEQPGGTLPRLEQLIARLCELFDDWVAVARLLLELRASDRGLFRPFFRRARGALAALVAEGQRTGEIDRALDPELVAATLIGVVDGVLLQLFVEPAAFSDRDALRDTLVRSAHKVLAP